MVGPLTVLFLFATPPASAWSAAMAEAWPAARAWSDVEEAGFARFVERLGRAVHEGRCARLDQCLGDPAANGLFDPMLDRGISLFADCADVPYTLRAYFAFRRKLPFVFVSRVEGEGPPGAARTAAPDERFLRRAHPAEHRAWRDFHTPKHLFEALPNLVHTGMLRIAASAPDGDFYPIRIQRGALRGGDVLYDPGGHVQVVAFVERDGTVGLIDGHPDGTLTPSRLALRSPGPAALGGGFKRFRPLRLDGQLLQRSMNVQLRALDRREQWDAEKWRAGGRPASYAAWVRSRLAGPGARIDRPLDFGRILDEVCRGLSDRAVVIEHTVAAGLPQKAHPAALPDNIYGGFGEWETHATPGKDTRLRAAVRDLFELARDARGRTRRALQKAWTDRAAAPTCRADYRRSDGVPVTLTLDDLAGRLFDLSFDPYDCPERRWGAPEGSPEWRACRASPEAARFYNDTTRLRNRLDRGIGEPTPLDAGPLTKPRIDPRPRLGIPIAKD